MARLRNIKLTIQYDGTAYSGWQWQNNAVGIQNIMEEAISHITGEDITLIGAGRTDKGVHALGQVAHFFTRSKVPDFAFYYTVNDILPDDILIIKSEEVPLDFHARFSAKSKTYCYTVHNAPYLSPLERLYKVHVRKPLDVEIMKLAAQCFLGEHDYRGFMRADSDETKTLREIDRIKIEKKGEDIIFTFQAESFLYNQVRIIVGTLVYIGMGKIPLENLPKIIDSGERDQAGPTFPAKGLQLIRVEY